MASIFNKFLQTKRDGLRERIRNWIGLRPHRHSFTISDYVRAQSYHCSFGAPQDQYVYACEVKPIGTTSNDHLVVAPTDGWGALDYAHIYVRPKSLPSEAMPREVLGVTVDVREQPPGLLGVVAVVAVTQASLIWVLGIFHTAFFGRPDLGVTNVPTLLLALTGLLSGWVGIQFSSDRMRWTSIATMVGIGLSGFVAIASTAVAVAKEAGAVGPDVGTEHPLWMALMFLSGLLACDLVVRTGARSVRFARRRARAGLVERFAV